MRRCTLFGFKWPVHNHVLVNGLFPWKGERVQVLYLTYVWLKKRPVFSSKCFNIFANGIWWCLGIDLIKTVSLFSSKELELLGLLYGLFQQFISFDQRWVHSIVVLVWVLRFNTNLRSFSNRHNSQTRLYGHSLNTDTSLLRTFYFFPGERKPLYFLFELFNTDTSLIRTLSMASSVLTGFDCILVSLWL